MRSLAVALIALIMITLPMTSIAAQFPVVGPRALGMGGASVAAVNDSTAVYWNPAALADFRDVEIRIPAGAAIHDYMDLNDNWDRIQEIYDAPLTPATASELESLLLELDRPDSVTNIDVNGGLLVSFPVASSSIAISVLGIGSAELFPTIDMLNMGSTISLANNNSAISAAGLTMAEPAVTFATSVGESFLIGVNAKMIYASTFLHSENIRTGNFDNFVDNMDNSETKSSKASLDAGILYKPLDGLNIGLVGRYLNSPSFPIKGMIAYQQPTGDVATTILSDEIEMKPQYRAGVAWKPLDNLTLSADYDLSKNKSFTESTEDQTIAGGLELTMLDEVLSLRAGAYKNTANSLSNLVYTAGVGVRVFFLRMDLAGAYDFEEQEGQAALSFALRF